MGSEMRTLTAVMSAVILAGCSDPASTDRPLQITVLSPQTGAVLPTESPVTLQAQVTDQRGQVTNKPITWTEGSNSLGTGASLKRSFASGVHTVCAQAAGAKECTTFSTMVMTLESLITFCKSAVYAGRSFPAGCVNREINNPGGHSVTEVWKLNGVEIPYNSGALALFPTVPGRYPVTHIVYSASPALVDSVTVMIDAVAPPPICGQLFGVGPQGLLPTAGHRVYLAKGLQADSADIGPDEKFCLKGSSLTIADTEVDIYVLPVDRTQTDFFPVFIRADSTRLRERRGIVTRPVNIRLTPQSWTVAAGRYRNLSGPVRLAEMFKKEPVPPPRNFSFISLSDSATRDGRYTYRENGWIASGLPAKVAIKRLANNHVVEAQDSITLWQALQDIKSFYGFFDVIAAQPEEVTSTTGITVTFDSIKATSAQVWIVNAGLDITGCNPNFQHKTFSRTNVLHEFTHCLGVGHWGPAINDSSVVPGVGSVNSRSIDPTLKDVLHLEVIYRNVEVRRQYDARFGIPESYNGWQMFVQKVAPQLPLYY
ncbi:MAG: hypothetical protein WEE89_13865 [Gemmatimonadota bacterium]